MSRRPRRLVWCCRSASTAASPPTSPPRDAVVADGAVGTPQLMRSLTRDPGLGDPAGVPPWTIFLADPDPRLRHPALAQPGRRAGQVYATADALVAPDFKDAGLLDTAVVVITFDNGAIAVAEASFSAAYGYDVRGEVFGSARHGHHGRAARSSLVHSTAPAGTLDTVRGDVELFRDAYTAEFAEFTDAVREAASPGGHRRGRPPRAGRGAGQHRVRRVPAPRSRSTRSTRDERRLRLHPGRLRGDGLPRPADRCERVRRIHDLGFAVEIWDWTAKDLGALAATGAAVHLHDRLHRGQPHRTGRRRRPAAHRRAVHRRRRPSSALPHLNLHGTGLDRARAAGTPRRGGHRADVAGRGKDPGPARRARRTRRRRVLPGEPQHRRRPPRHAVRQSRRHPRPGPRPSAARTCG